MRPQGSGIYGERRVQEAEKGEIFEEAHEAAGDTSKNLTGSEDLKLKDG